MKLEPILNKAPRIEVEIYRGLIKNAIHQLGILKAYDAKFIFLETQLLTHLKQIDLTIEAMAKDNAKRSH